MSALAPDSVDPTDLTVPYYDLALSLLITMQSLATYCIYPSSISFPQNMAVVNGGFGTVQQGILRVHDGSTIAVAVKKLRPAGNEIQRLRTAVALAREVKVWAGLHHPNIVPLFGYHLDMRYDCAWLISGWESLGDIQEYLANTQPDQETRLQLVRDTAYGLAYLHNRTPAVCHGDVKLANVLINHDRRAMWCDFGLAQAMDCGPSGLTTSKTYTGTIPYVSAELLNGDTCRTLKSDIWAWGCVFLEVMTDGRPFQHKRNEMAVMLAIAQGELPASIDSLPILDFGRAVLKRCWSLEATSRPTMTWCSEVLTRRTTALFKYKSEGDGWRQIRNPDLGKVYEFEFLPSFPDLDVHRFAFSPDGRTIALVTVRCGPMRLYNAETGQMQSNLDCPNDDYGHMDEFYAVCFSHSSPLLATGHGSGVIRIWDPSTWTLRRELKGLRESISSITFSHSDVILASIDEHSLCTWNVQNGTLLQIIPDISHDIVVGSFHHPFILAVGLFGGTGILYDAELGGCQNQLEFAGPAVFMPDGAGFISGRVGEGLTTWDVRPLLEHRKRISNGEISSSNRDEPKLSGTTIKGPQYHITAFSVSSDGQLLASRCSRDDSCVLWDLENRRPLLRVGGDKFRYVNNLSFRHGSTASQGTLAYTYLDLVANKRILQLVRYKLCS